MTNPPHEEAPSWFEAGVLIVLLGVLSTLVFAPVLARAMVKGQATQCLSNMKQLHLATQSLALDATTTGATNSGWPGDTGGSYYLWARQLVPAYLSTNDFCKLLSAEGKVVPLGQIPYSTHDSAVLIYAVREDSPGSDVFLTSANFTNTPRGGAPLYKKALPFGDRCFVVFRKGGDGAVLLPGQVGKTNAIGSYVPLLK